jgi:hypothetical protein
MNLPSYEFLPAPLWLITGLHVLTLSLHFVAMNFLVGGVVAVFWGKLGGASGHPLSGTLVRLFPSLMAATVTLGVAPLLFLQLVYPRQVYAAAIVMGWFWMAVAAAVILSYYLLYAASHSQGPGMRRRRLYVGVALLGLVYVSLLYSSVFSLAERPELIRQLYARTQSGLSWNPALGDYSFRWLHMILGAVTVGGFFVGLLGRADDAAFRLGRNFFLWGMVGAALAGFAWLFSLGNDLNPLMRTPAIWALNLGIVLAAGALHFFFQKRFLPSGAALFVSLILMVYTRHQVRLLRLDGAYDPSSLPVTPQWSVFAVFLACLLAAIAAVALMLRMFFRASGDAR